MEEQQLELLKRIAAAVAAQFGDHCEVLVHDLTVNDPSRTVVAIENGHVSHRSLGSGPSHIVLEAMREGQAGEDQLHYLTKTADGRILRSSTVYIKDGAGKPMGIFAINYDLTDLMMMQGIVNSLVNDGSQSQIQSIPTNVNELLDDLLEQSVRLVGKPVALMNKEDRLKAISFLNDAGAMLVTKGGDKIAHYFGISKFTLYSYLDSINNNSGNSD